MNSIHYLMKDCKYSSPLNTNTMIRYTYIFVKKYI